MKLARAGLAKRFIDSSHTLADISCGSGYLSRLLPYSKYIGVDQPDMIPLILNDGRYVGNNVSFKPFDFDETSQDLDLGVKVDRLISFETIEHLEDPERFLYNLGRNLKRDGLLLLSTPNNPWNSSPKSTYHLKEYSRKEIHALLDKSDFDIQQDHVMGIGFGLLNKVFTGIGVKTYRQDPTTEERGRLSRIMDHIGLLRRIYCTILSYDLLDINVGDSGSGMIILASKK